MDNRGPAAERGEAEESKRECFLLLLSLPSFCRVFKPFSAKVVKLSSLSGDNLPSRAFTIRPTWQDTFRIGNDVLTWGQVGRLDSLLAPEMAKQAGGGLRGRRRFLRKGGGWKRWCGIIFIEKSPLFPRSKHGLRALPAGWV